MGSNTEKKPLLFIDILVYKYSKLKYRYIAFLTISTAILYIKNL